MKVFKLFVASLIFTSLLVPQSVWSRDLSRRLGLGFVDQFSTATNKNIPQLDVKYAFTKDIAVAIGLGFHTASPETLVVSSKFFKNIFYESNLNFYGAINVGYIRDIRSSVEFLGLLGAEFFIPGVESVGFSFEAGISLSNVTGKFHLRSVGFSFLQAGMHFYF